MSTYPTVPDEDTTQSAPASSTATERQCPRGCTDADDCKASIAIPCPLGRYGVDDSGKFQPCGHLERERCGSCGCCTNCDGCYCGEDY